MYPFVECDYCFMNVNPSKMSHKKRIPLPPTFSLFRSGFPVEEHEGIFILVELCFAAVASIWSVETNKLIFPSCSSGITFPHWSQNKPISGDRIHMFNPSYVSFIVGIKWRRSSLQTATVFNSLLTTPLEISEVFSSLPLTLIWTQNRRWRTLTQMKCLGFLPAKEKIFTSFAATGVLYHEL